MEILTINPVEVFEEYRLRNEGRDPRIIIINPITYLWMLNHVTGIREFKTFGGVRLIRSEDIEIDKFEIY